MTDLMSDESPEKAEFRLRARKWLALNAELRRKRPSGAEDEDEFAELMQQANEPGAVKRAKEFQAKLFDAGLAGLTFPQEYGGQGLPRDFQWIWSEEAAPYDVPGGVFTIGFGMCIPTVLTHGTEEQKGRYVRPALRGAEIWSQLFSEPGAGSDVASLQSRAVRDGDEWILNGQKVWTSGAHYSDYGIVIARTDPDQPKHRGITMFILDFHAPGVSVKPLRQMTGGANFNEVFFDDVRIPDSSRVGDVNEGWRCAITTLMNERVAIGASGGGSRGGGADTLIRAAKRAGVEKDPVIRQRLMQVYIKSSVMGYVGKRISEAIRAGRVPGPEGSVAKLSGALLAKESADLAMAIAGASGIAWREEDAKGSRWSTMLCGAPASGIAGGSNEVMRNIIGERVLGLPKEPQVDRDIPFRELRVGTQKSV